MRLIEITVYILHIQYNGRRKLSRENLGQQTPPECRNAPGVFFEMIGNGNLLHRQLAVPAVHREDLAGIHLIGNDLPADEGLHRVL